MASRKSAFNVFRAKERSLKKDADVMDIAATRHSGSDIGEALPKLQDHGGSMPDVSKISEDYESDLSLTPPVTKKHFGNKSEPRFNSFRKSIRKRQKKDAHHEINLTQVGKENKIHKVFSQGDWTDKLQELDSLTLEEQFLPEVTKQRKEQEDLHNVAIVNIKDNINYPTMEGPKSSSPDKNMPINCKPPVVRRFSVVPEKGRKRSHSLSDTTSSAKEQEKVTSGDKLFEWLIAPVTSEQFFSDVWQRKPCYIKRRQPKYNHIWFSTKELDKILRTQNVQFTKNLDVAVYRNGKRETLNPEGRAFAPAVWKFYQEGCSLRLLNPQTFSKNVWRLTSKLQEYFGCFAGSNVYLTPPGSQGFAPHYDDIEAFVVQLEGKKHWRLYSSRNVNEILPRYSSENLPQEGLGEPILDRVLEPGDTLYFPRGVIHQGVTMGDQHSLHITLSLYQKYNWSDYMEKLIPMALQSAIEEDVEFRKALPIGCHRHIGVANSDKSTLDRKAFIRTAQQLVKKLASYVAVDLAADELVLDQMDEFLPPCLTTDEAECSVFGNGAFWDGSGVHGQSKFDLDTEVKLTRPGIARLIGDDEGVHVHYTVENSREYKEVPLKRIEIPVEMASAAEFLLSDRTDYVKVEQVPLEGDEAKISLSKQFYDMGLLRTKVPLPQ